MSAGKERAEASYGCADYREEMRLLGLKRRLENPGLSESEREGIKAEITRLEEKMGLD